MISRLRSSFPSSGYISSCRSREINCENIFLVLPAVVCLGPVDSGSGSRRREFECQVLEPPTAAVHSLTQALEYELDKAKQIDYP